MATITLEKNEAYVSGDVAVSLNKGDLIVVCAYWEWYLNASYEYTTGAIYVDGNEITGYGKQIKATETGFYMKIAPYVAVENGDVNISLVPTDAGADRVLRLYIVKIVPTTAEAFITGYLIGSDDDGRNTGTGGTLNIPNAVGDFLVGMSCGIATTGTLDWTAPASELGEANDTTNMKTSVGVQISESINDAFIWTASAGFYTGGVGIAVRESVETSGEAGVFLSDGFGFM